MPDIFPPNTDSGGVNVEPTGDPGLQSAETQLAIATLYSIVITLFNQLLNMLSGIVKAIKALFKHVHDWLLKAWQNYIRKALDWLIKHFRKWIDWLRRHAKSVIDHLKKWKKWYDQHILPFQLKQIALIQHIRQILGILRAFHVKWATQLDQKLGDLQSRIVGTIELIRGSLNSIINFAGLIFDPSLLIRRNALAGSLLASLGALKRIAGFGSGLPMSKGQQGQVDRWKNYYTKSETLSYMKTVAATGPTDEDRQYDSDARNAMSTVTGVAQ